MPARKRGRTPPSDAERCTGKTGTGKRCAKRRASGLEVCAQHAEGAKRGGRPASLTDEASKAILAVLAVGGIVGDAAVAAGVARSTVFAWLDRGDPEGDAPEDAPYREFRAEVDKAVAEVKQRVVASIVDQSKADWRAGAWYLRNVDPDNWGASVATRAEKPRGKGPSVGEPPQLTVVTNDQVCADGRAL